LIAHRGMLTSQMIARVAYAKGISPCVFRERARMDLVVRMAFELGSTQMRVEELEREKAANKAINMPVVAPTESSVVAGAPEASTMVASPAETCTAPAVSSSVVTAAPAIATLETAPAEAYTKYAAPAVCTNLTETSTDAGAFTSTGTAGVAVKQKVVPLAQKVQKPVAIPVIEPPEKAVDIPIFEQAAFPQNQTIEKAAEIPQIQAVDKVVEVPEAQIVAGATRNVNLPPEKAAGEDVDVPGVQQRHWPSVQRVQKLAAVPVMETAEKDVPVIEQAEVPQRQTIEKVDGGRKTDGVAGGSLGGATMMGGTALMNTPSTISTGSAAGTFTKHAPTTTETREAGAPEYVSGMGPAIDNTVHKEQVVKDTVSQNAVEIPTVQDMAQIKEMAAARMKNELRKWCAETFAALDQNGKGYVTRAEVLGATSENKSECLDDDGDTPAQDLLDFIFRRVDVDGKGHLTLADFECFTQQIEEGMDLLGSWPPEVTPVVT